MLVFVFKGLTFILFVVGLDLEYWNDPVIFIITH